MTELTPTIETGSGVCYQHPDVETGLRCNRCNKLICVQCAKRSAVGFQCPECVDDAHRRYYKNVKGYVNPYEQPMQQPFITFLMVGLIVTIWFLMEARGGSQDNQVLINFGANYGPRIFPIDSPTPEFWRFFTSMFLHIGLMHLLFNSIGLVIFGVEMEQIYGNIRYLIIYLLSGLFGSLASFAWSGPGQFSAGASGAIFGIVGVQLAFFLFYRRKMGDYGKFQVQRVIRITIFSLIFGLFMPIDQAAHFGGLAAGFVLGYGLAPRYQIQEGKRGLIDYGSLLRRWWVIALGIILLFLGTGLTVMLWLQFFGIPISFTQALLLVVGQNPLQL